MAQIKMDVSEYDEMKKNALLLEEALKREKEQNDRISTLEKEKIDALKANEKSVTVIKRSEVHEYLLQRRSPNEIIQSMNQFVQGARRGSYTMEYATDRLNNFESIFFDKSKSYSIPSEEVTIKGLDEVKAEIRRDVENKISEETKSKLYRLDIVEGELKKVKAEKEETEYELRLAHKKNESVIKFKDIAHAELENTQEELKVLRERVSKLKEGVNEPFNFFNAYSKLSKLRNLF